VRRFAFRVAVLVVLGGAAIAAASTAAVFWLTQGVSAPANGDLAVPGLAAPARIVRDPFGIPHVEARTLEDAYRGLGVAQAQDRLWQMDLLRRHARGTLSELFGARTLAQDRLARTLGLAMDAEEEWGVLSRRERRLLVAYAEGVNAWLARVRAGSVPRPFEMGWLGQEDIADWTPQDTLALARFRSWALSRTLGVSLLLQRLLVELGSADSRDFFPDHQRHEEPSLVGSLEGLTRLSRAWTAGAGLRGPVGSLGFVVGAKRAKGGLPILANDTHLEFQIPALPYPAHLKTPELDLAGVTWPGLPVFLAGRNRRIAWGQVALHASTSDVFDETLHPDGPERYDRNGRWLDTVSREERIAVRSADDELLVVRATRHGPLLGSALPDEPALQSYALRWTGQHRSSGFRELLRVQQAEDWKGFRAALSGYPAPAATFLYADVDGNSGLQLAGHLPIRSIPTEFLPVPGRTRYYDWRGFMEFEELPSGVGRKLDWLVAETQPRRDGFPAPVAWLWNDGGGASRLRARLRAARKLDLAQVLELQRERRSARASDELRRLVEPARGHTGRGARVREILLAWDGDTGTDSVGAAVYHAFRYRLAQRLLHQRLDGRVDPALLEGVEPPPGVLLSRFLDRASPREGPDLVEAVLEETWSWLGVNVSSNPKKWTWGELHRLRLEHPFERLSGGLLRVVGRSLGRGPFAAPGDQDSIWAMYHGELPGEAAVGPVLRWAVDLGDPDHAQIGLAGGQSGQPGTVHYDDALTEWLRGAPRPLWTHPRDVAYHARGTWELSLVAR
jgi:penicillin amidase